LVKKALQHFTTSDLVIIALLSAGGIATKPFVRLLAQVFTGSLIPIGTVAGIFYMLWIVLACCIVQKRGTAILVGIVQSVLVIVFDMLGNRGLANLLVYVIPGMTLELVMLLFPRYVSNTFSSFTAGGVANATGAIIVGWLFMRLPAIPLLGSTSVSLLFGGIGGVVAYKLYAIVKGFSMNPKEPENIKNA
jgi:hypothetical protein